MKGSFIWLKKFDTGIITFLYSFLHLAFLRFDGFIAVKLLLIFIVSFAAKKIGPHDNRILKVIVFIIIATAMVLVDEMIIPDMAAHLRIRWIMLISISSIMALMQRIDAGRIWTGFLGINSIFICIYLLISSIGTKDFIIDPKPQNAVFESLSASLEKGKGMTLILSDGYPSDSILSKYYGIRSGLPYKLEGFVKRAHRSRYTSTPISVSNLLFGAVFGTDQESFGIRGMKTELDLVQDAFEKSSFRELSRGYESAWFSFIFSKEISNELDLSYWKRTNFRSLFDNLYIQHVGYGTSTDHNIKNYNGRMLAGYKHRMDEVRSEKNFTMLHFLTFHSSGFSMKEQVAYADSLIAAAIVATPKDHDVIVFSDHGLKESQLSDGEKRSGICYVRTSE